MDQAADKASGKEASSAARYSVLMAYLYPDQPEKRFRRPEVSSSGKAGPAMGGEDFFTENAGSRRN